MAPATLTLTRRRTSVQRQPFEIALDGTVVDTIARGQTVELPLEPGRHTLQLRSGRQTSPQRQFDAGDGETVNFWCRGALIWPIYVASLLKPDLGITLRRE